MILPNINHPTTDPMPSRTPIIHQRRSDPKLERARELRRQATPEEKSPWTHLRAHHLAGLGFRRQHLLHGFILDFYCPSAGLAVEIDGSHHQSQQEQDAQRDQALASYGIHTLRIPNAEIRTNLPALLQQILQAARSADSD